VESRCKGENPAVTAARLGITGRQAYRILRAAAERTRDHMVEILEARLAEHDAKCEWLYDVCARKIQTLVDKNEFDANVIRAAIAVLERQAKLLGLDKTKLKQGPGNADWMDTADDAALVRAADRMGIKLPESFRLASGAAGVN
jgi:hypothetical protein